LLSAIIGVIRARVLPGSGDFVGALKAEPKTLPSSRRTSHPLAIILLIAAALAGLLVQIVDASPNRQPVRGSRMRAD